MSERASEARAAEEAWRDALSKKEPVEVDPDVAAYLAWSHLSAKVPASARR